MLSQYYLLSEKYPLALTLALAAGTAVFLIASVICLKKVINLKLARKRFVVDDDSSVLCVNKRYYKAHFISGGESGDIIFAFNADLDSEKSAKYIEAYLTLVLNTSWVYVFGFVEVGFDKFIEAKNKEDSFSAHITV